MWLFYIEKLGIKDVLLIFCLVLWKERIFGFISCYYFTMDVKLYVKLIYDNLVFYEFFCEIGGNFVKYGKNFNICSGFFIW